MPDIVKIKPKPKVNNFRPTNPVHIHNGKFYFWEEHFSGRHGPYKTREEAALEWRKYNFFLLHDREPTEAELKILPPMRWYSTR